MDSPDDIEFVIADYRLEPHGNAQPRELFRQKEGIGIDRSSDQEFGPDGNRFSNQGCFGLHDESCI